MRSCYLFNQCSCNKTEHLYHLRRCEFQTSQVLINMNITHASTSSIVTTVKGYYINHVICFQFNVLIIFSSTILNTTTVLAYWKSSQLRKKTSYFLIMLLSLSDLGTALGCSLFHSITLLRNMLGLENSSLTSPFIILTYVFSGMSYSILCVLNIERYLGIVHPLFHRKKVNKARVLKAIVLFWLGCLIVGSLILLDTKIGNFVLGTSMSLNLTILITIYVKIFLTGGGTATKNFSGSGNTQLKAYLRKIKLAKSCLIVVGCSYVCFVPTAVMPFLPDVPFVYIVLRAWTANLLFANSTVNSVIFFWRNKILRNEAKLIFSQYFKRPQ